MLALRDICGVPAKMHFPIDITKLLLLFLSEFKMEELHVFLNPRLLLALWYHS